MTGTEEPRKREDQDGKPFPALGTPHPGCDWSTPIDSPTHEFFHMGEQHFVCYFCGKLVRAESSPNGK